MIIAVPATEVARSIEILTAQGENAWHIGEIADMQAGQEQVIINKG